MPRNKRYTFLHHNLVSVDWLYCTGEWTQIWLSDNMQIFLEARFLRVDMLGPSCAHTRLIISMELKTHTRVGTSQTRIPYETNGWSQCRLPGCDIVLQFFWFFCFFNLFLACWVFITACGLSLVVVSGGYSSLQCTGFSLQWLLLLWSTGSRHAGFSSCGSQALERRLSSCGAQA